jgi:hypothetical protein
MAGRRDANMVIVGPANHVVKGRLVRQRLPAGPPMLGERLSAHVPADEVGRRSETLDPAPEEQSGSFAPGVCISTDLDARRARIDG